MPSHVTHLLLAEEASRQADLAQIATGETRKYLILGSQGPDIFYHNQRRKPSGLTYGSVMHRSGYGKAVSEMARWAWEQGLGLGSWAGAWVLGFASHAILDRRTHPYINYFSGWVEPGDPHTEQFRSMHPFLERLIDVAMLERRRNLHPNELDFFSVSTLGDEPPNDWIILMENALKATYTVAAKDTELAARLQSAYLDTNGYYRFTNVVDRDYLREGLSREQRGEIGSKWLSIVHPLEIPGSLDVLNDAGVAWSHPCDEAETRDEGFVELFERARDETAAMFGIIAQAWNSDTDDTENRRQTVEDAVANWNLSDGRPTRRPCRKTHAAPLPLREAQQQMKKAILKAD